MLIIQREKGQEIVIDSNIIVRVEDIDEGRVKLVIEGPKETDFIRTESSDDYKPLIAISSVVSRPT